MSRFVEIQKQMAQAREKQDEKSREFLEAKKRRMEEHKRRLEIMVKNRRRGE